MDLTIAILEFICYGLLFYLYLDLSKRIIENKKEIKKMKKRIKKLENNQFYVFDYLEGIYEELERGSLDEKYM